MSLPEKKPVRRPNSVIVTLTTGFEVDLQDDDSLEHLFNAIMAEWLSYFAKRNEMTRPDILTEVRIKFDRELHYVAGQMHCLKSNISLERLLDEFKVHWDGCIKRSGLPGIHGE